MSDLFDLVRRELALLEIDWPIENGRDCVFLVLRNSPYPKFIDRNALPREWRTKDLSRLRRDDRRRLADVEALHAKMLHDVRAGGSPLAILNQFKDHLSAFSDYLDVVTGGAELEDVIDQRHAVGDDNCDGRGELGIYLIKTYFLGH